jgi:hypothetical protein
VAAVVQESGNVVDLVMPGEPRYSLGIVLSSAGRIERTRLGPVLQRLIADSEAGVVPGELEPV